VTRAARLWSGCAWDHEAIWGTLTVWAPPHCVVFSWHPGEELDKATHVELRFTASGTRTRVELRHSGFERLGPLAAHTKRMYPIGWASRILAIEVTA
jgi:uncharacterized protein YndB with AHSA1/START domain